VLVPAPPALTDPTVAEVAPLPTVLVLSVFVPPEPVLVPTTAVLPSPPPLVVVCWPEPPTEALASALRVPPIPFEVEPGSSLLHP
jgi:hypothetical protein